MIDFTLFLALRTSMLQNISYNSTFFRNKCQSWLPRLQRLDNVYSIVHVIFNTQNVYHLAKISYFCICNSSLLMIVVETMFVRAAKLQSF